VEQEDLEELQEGVLVILLYFQQSLQMVVEVVVVMLHN
jgi:hypothetical protein